MPLPGLEQDRLDKSVDPIDDDHLSDVLLFKKGLPCDMILLKALNVLTVGLTVTLATR